MSEALRESRKFVFRVIERHGLSSTLLSDAALTACAETVARTAVAAQRDESGVLGSILRMYAQHQARVAESHVRAEANRCPSIIVVKR